jgi:hypothetical protein
MGPWTGASRGCAGVGRCIDASPRCDERLSMTQDIRRALLYGAWLMTCSSKSSNGAMPVLWLRGALQCGATRCVGDALRCLETHRAAVLAAF